MAETVCISLFLLQTTNVWLAKLLPVAVLAAVALPGGAGRGHAQSCAERLLLRLQGAGVQALNLVGGWWKMSRRRLVAQRVCSLPCVAPKAVKRMTGCFTLVMT